jgi:hypothetical protein
VLDDVVGDREPDDRVAEEFEPFIRDRIMLGGVGGVRQRFEERRRLRGEPESMSERRDVRSVLFP